MSNLTDELKRAHDLLSKIEGSTPQARWKSSRFIITAIAIPLLLLLFYFHFDALLEYVWKVYALFMLCRTLTDLVTSAMSGLIKIAAIKALGLEGKLDASALGAISAADTSKPPTPAKA